jgi:hypothetical protein
MFIIGDNAEFSFNTIRATNHGINEGPPQGRIVTCGRIHDNDIAGGAEWDEDGTNAYHHDPIFLFTGAPGQCAGAKIYNNYIHGVLSSGATSHITGYVFIDPAGWHAPNGIDPVFPNIYTFNNVIDAAPGATNYPANEYFTGAGEEGSVLANNTVTATTGNGGYNFIFETAAAPTPAFTNIQAYNNLFLGPEGASLWESKTPYPGSKVDYNIYAGAGTVNAFGVQTGNVNSFAGWQAVYGDNTGGFDAHGANPSIASVQLNPTSYTLGAGSTAIGAGKNLTSLCGAVPELCFDKAGNPRPATGAWDAGAYQSAPANTFYVRAGATGNGSGSDWTNAYTQLPSNLTRGAIYYVADGTYPSYAFVLPANSSATLITVKKATPANHGTGVGWSDGYGQGQAVFSAGLSQTTNTNGYLTIDGQIERARYGFKINFADGDNGVNF